MKNNCIDIQLFAEAVPSSDTQGADETPPIGTPTPIFSSEQQKYIDDIVAKTVGSITKTADKKVSAIEEAQRLAGMTAEQRVQAELESYKQKATEYEKEKLVFQFKTELGTKGLPQNFADILDVENAEAAAKAIDFLNGYKQQLEKSYADKIKALEEELKNANLRNPAPKSFNASNIDPLAFNRQQTISVQPWNAVNYGK